MLNIFVYNFIFVFVYDFLDNVPLAPDGVFDELCWGVGFYDCFYDLGRDWFVDVVLLSIEGEVVGRFGFNPIFFFIYNNSTSSFSSRSEWSELETGEFIPAIKLLWSLLMISLVASCESERIFF